MWTLPVLIFAATFALAIPVGLYMAWVFEGRYRATAWLRWVGSAGWTPGRRTGSSIASPSCCSTWSRSSSASRPDACSRICRSILTAREMLAPSTIFNTVFSFPDQHQPAALLGRSPPLLLQPAVLHLLEADSLAGDRPGGPAGHHPRPARRQAPGQLLRRPVARDGLLLRAAVPGRRPCCSWPAACR